jgi:CTP:molybdopterin cytidylyltransferase MocA
VGGRPWIEVQLESLARAGMTEVIVVLGYDSEAYLQPASWLQQAATARGANFLGATVRAVLNPRPEYGPFTSIQAGASAALGARAPAAYVLPIDVIAAGARVWRALGATRAVAAIPTIEGRGGHPVFLSGGLLAKLAALPPEHPDSRLDRQLRLLSDRIERIEVDDRLIISNLNTPDEWARAAINK